MLVLFSFRRYYDGGISSFYLWDQEEEEPGSFAGSLLFKKGSSRNPVGEETPARAKR